MKQADKQIFEYIKDILDRNSLTIGQLVDYFNIDSRLKDYALQKQLELSQQKYNNMLQEQPDQWSKKDLEIAESKKTNPLTINTITKINKGNKQNV